MNFLYKSMWRRAVTLVDERGARRALALGQLCPHYLRSLRATEAEHHGRPRVAGGTHER